MTIKTKKKYIIKNKENLGNLPIWDLSDLYSSTKSKKITSDLEFISKKSKNFEKKYEGKISSLNSSNLLFAIQEFEKINEKMGKLYSFAQLLYSENIEDKKNKIFFQKIKEKIISLSSSLVFFNLELNTISKKKLKNLFISKDLTKYKTWIENSRTYKPHQLDKKLEQLMQDKKITSSSAWVRLFDETIASLRFPFRKRKISKSYWWIL